MDEKENTNATIVEFLGHILQQAPFNQHGIWVATLNPLVAEDASVQQAMQIVADLRER